MTAYAYDAAGRQHEVTDNAGMVTRTEYDALGRPRKVIENVVDGSPETGDADEDRTTLYAYNGAGQITQQTADLNDFTSGSGGDQTTHYIYSGELAGSASGGPVPSRGLLRAVVYPDALEDGESRAGVISKLNGGASGDFVETTYYADGAQRSRTDQRGVTLTYHYNDDGTRRAQVASNFDADTDDAVKSMTYTYDDLQRLDTVSSHSSAQASPTPFDVVNQVTHEYTGLGQLAKQRQDLDSAVDDPAPGGLPTQDVAYTYDTSTSGGGAFTKAARRASVTYPNGRVLHTLYDAAPLGTAPSGGGGGGVIDDALSRPNGLADAAPGSPGTPGDTLVAYAHTGDGRTVVKDLPRIAVRLDQHQQLTGDNPSDYLPGLDRFGRVTRLRWDRYDPAPAPGTYASLDNPVFDLRHGYDAASNRLYTDRRVYRNDAEHYAHDGLHRLRAFNKGVLENDLSAVSHWNRVRQAWDLDALGNPLAIDTTDATDASVARPNDANEINDRYVRTRQRATVADTFGSASTEPDWDVPGSDGFDINTSNSGALTFTSVAADTFDGHTESEARAVLLWSHDLGPFNAKTQFYVPTGTAAGKFGLVFGYKSPNDYWTVTQDLATNTGTVHHVVNGDPGPALSTANYTWPYASNRNQYVVAGPRSIGGQTFGDYTFPNGLPTGRMGIFSTAPGVRARFIHAYPPDFAMDVAGRWSSLGVGQQDHTGRLKFRPEKHELGSLAPRGVRTRHFDAEFVIQRSASNSGVYFEFDAEGPASTLGDSRRSVVHVKHSTNPGSLTVQHNGAVPAATINTGLPACPNPSDRLWVRVLAEPPSGGSGGDTVTVYARVGGTSPPAWAAGDIVYRSTDFDLVGGRLGFHRYWQGYPWVDEVTVKTWSDTDLDGTADAWVTELTDAFDVSPHPDGGAGHFAHGEPEHDAAGNLTYDGVYAYSYDAWNRLARITKAYREPGGGSGGSGGGGGGGVIRLGSVVQTSSYDALGRRVARRVHNSADLDATHLYYHDGQSVVEVHNGSGLVVTQHVWGLDYIDELIENRLNQDPIDTTEQSCERPFYAVHNAQYNVLGILQPTAVYDRELDIQKGQRLVERYEYTPYGQRVVYSHGWLLADVDGNGEVDGRDHFVWQVQAYYGPTASASPSDVNGDGVVDGTDEGIIQAAYGDSVPWSDPLLLTPSSTGMSHRATHAEGGGLGVVLNPIGHQGLSHDEETGLVYNRARYLHPQLGRFMQRDPLGYIDGMSTYAYYAGIHGLFDPFGLSTWDNGPSWHHLIPQEFRDRVGGSIDGKDFGHLLRNRDHSDLHNAGWNDEWRKFFEECGDNPTKQDLLDQLKKMQNDPRFKDILKRGVPAIWSHSEWLAKSGEIKRRVAARLARRLAAITAKTGSKKVGKGFLASLPGISLAFSALDYSARAETYGRGGAIGLTILDNIPIVDIAVAGSEGLDAINEEKRIARQDAAREERQLLEELVDEARKAAEEAATPPEDDGCGCGE